MGVLVYDGVMALDATGPVDVFGTANDVLDGMQLLVPRYEPFLVSLDDSRVRSEHGVVLEAVQLVECGPLDTLIVAGGKESQHLSQNDKLVGVLRDVAIRVPRVATICTGTFLGAAAGFFSTGTTVTTHWGWHQELAAAQPDLVVDPDPIVIMGDRASSSAGVTAGLDLALAFVKADCGVEIARWVARGLVMTTQRGGGQSQFAPDVWSPEPMTDLVASALAHIETSLASRLTVQSVAAAVGVSERHLARRFRTELDSTVISVVRARRVAAARHLLETSNRTVDDVAKRCGFGSSESLRRTFHDALAISPTEYRNRFS